ncbi:hypothetical protein C7212DRAFT_318187, partial [Tuber magnatum]
FWGSCGGWLDGWSSVVLCFTHVFFSFCFLTGWIDRSWYDCMVCTYVGVDGLNGGKNVDRARQRNAEMWQMAEEEIAKVRVVIDIPTN